MLVGLDASRAALKQATGTEYYSWSVINHLMQAAPQHHYRLYTRPGLSARFEPPHERVEIATRRLWTHIGLDGELRRRPPDVLFVPAHTLPIACAIAPPRLRYKPLPRIVTLHDVGYRHFPDAHPLRQRLYLEFSTWLSANFADHLIVDSIATRDDVAHIYGVPTSKMTVVYPGPLPLLTVNESDFVAVQRKWGLDNRPYVLYVGTLQPRKNIPRLIEAWREVCRAWATGQPNRVLPMLVLAGKAGWGNVDVAGLVAQYGLNDQVLLTGYVSELEKSALMRGAQGFAFPSLYEGFGFPVLEAQSVGVPVLCSGTSSLIEVAGDSALIVDPLSVAAITQGLWRLLTHAPTRARLREAGLRNVQRFNWQTCARQILGVMEDVCR